VDTHNEKGATLVETAITLPLFLLILFGIIQFCLIAYTAFTLQYQVNKCLRWSSTSAQPVPNEAKFVSISNRLSQHLNNFHIPTDNLQVNMCNGAVSDCNDTNPGASGSFVTLQAKVPAPALFPMGGITVAGRAVIKNEPF